MRPACANLLVARALSNRGSAILLIALATPSLARAECLGQGCYDGLLYWLIGLGLAALAVTLLILWLLWRVIKHFRDKRRGDVTRP